MRKISRFLVCDGKNTVELPTGARVLTVQTCEPANGHACIVVLADENRPTEKRIFWGLRTNVDAADHVAGSDCEHVGSWGDFHVFEQRVYHN